MSRSLVAALTAALLMVPPLIAVPSGRDAPAWFQNGHWPGADRDEFAIEAE